MGFFAALQGLHNGVENSVENVENLDKSMIYKGGKMVMGKIMQQHFRGKWNIWTGNVGGRDGRVCG